MITAAAAARGVMAISTVTTLKAVNLRRRKTFLLATRGLTLLGKLFFAGGGRGGGKQ